MNPAFKPKKKKIIISLVPFYLFILFIPFRIDSVWKGFSDSIIGLFLDCFSALGYLIFLMMLYPFYPFLEKLGLVRMKGIGVTVLAMPDISFWGFILLAFIYSCIIYVIISLRERRGKI